MRNKTVGKWCLRVVSVTPSCSLWMPPREPLCVCMVQGGCNWE